MNKNDDVHLSEEFKELAKIIKHKRENGENCDDDLKKLSEIMKTILIIYWVIWQN